MPDIPSKVSSSIDDILAFYENNRYLVETTLDVLVGQIRSHDDLMSQVHSVRSRLKSASSLRDKLERQYLKAVQESRAFAIDDSNLFDKINDLAGIRLLHLHTRQFDQINHYLSDVLCEYKYKIIEGPSARTWDDEYRNYFNEIGIDTISSSTMYTSVHYIVESNSRTPITVELQVRTLMEEVWGEVDHMINYPHTTEHLPVREQILALARSTSAATRLVDAIFRSFEDLSNICNDVDGKR